jgi:hypothetical protein
MKNDPAYYLNKLKEKYLLLRSGEIFLLALAAACIAFGVTYVLNISALLGLIIASASAVTVFAILFHRSKPYRFDANRLAAFINHHYPVMQHSADLLLKDPRTLTSLQEIQKEKIRRNFEQIFSTIKLPHQIDKALIVLATSAALTAALLIFMPETRRALEEKSESAVVESASSLTLPASVTALTVKVTPPPYTGVAPYATKEPNISIPEGSLVRWEIAFSDRVEDAALVFTRHDSLKLSPAQQNYRAQTSFSESDIYQLLWRPAHGEQQTSDYYQAEVIRDQPPTIAVLQLPEYTEISLDDNQNVTLRVNLSDDYGLKDAYITATVSKGSGESIKFREDKLPFASPARINGRRAKGTRIIDLKTLGLEPGDELYFYVEALDNKKPSANRSRTKTYFISLRDTASQMLSVEAGLGVDLLPAYFRSQRQIILDSERLLRERKAISQQEFNSRSNEIGYDQKVLRLKYGEFLGEEFETNIGPGHEPEEPEAEEKHHHEQGEKEDPTEVYKHIHDDPEEATFFTESIRAKLKVALTAMWDAELHLRTFDPKKSLPYQYIALRLLKQISRDSRIYVHKTGFDPPPLKEEKRLTGNLSDISNGAHKRNVSDAESYPAVRSALGVVEESLVRSDSSLSATARQAFLNAGDELAALALNEPGKYLHALSVIKSLSDNEVDAEDLRHRLLFLRKVFWSVLPKEMAAADKAVDGHHNLDRAFMNNLKSLSND